MTTQHYAVNAAPVVVVDPSEWRERVGLMLERARLQRRLSKRAAAKAAGFSEGIWRQLEDGSRSLQGNVMAANPRDETLESAARAVGLDPAEVFKAAGRDYVPVPEDTSRDASLEARIAKLEQAWLGEAAPTAPAGTLEQRLARLEAEQAKRGVAEGDEGR